MKRLFTWATKRPRHLRSSVGFEKPLGMRPHFGYHIRDPGDLGKIHEAARWGDVAGVQQLLFSGYCSVNDKDYEDRTALHWACANGHTDVVRLLIERNCLIDPVDRRNATPLMKAIQCLDEECVTLLLDHGAEPNHTDNTGNTALHYVAYGENIRMAKKLLSHKADIERRNKNYLTPLLIAILENRENMVKFLVTEKANIYAADNMNRTALMFAAQYSSANTVSFLLERGVDVFSEDIFGHSAKAYALHNRNMENYQLILYCEGEHEREIHENHNPEVGSSKENTTRFSEKLSFDHQLTTVHDEGVTLFVKEDSSKPVSVKGENDSAVPQNIPEEQPNKDGTDGAHGVQSESNCRVEDETEESTLDPKEGVSLSAGEKSEKCIVITQLASDKPALRHELNSDQELDDNKKNGKEWASESDSEEIQSPWNSEEELFPEPKMNENNAQFISFIKQFVRMQGIAPNPGSGAEAVESPWDSEEETTTPASGKSENEISVIQDTPEEEENCKLFCGGELDKDHINDMVCTLRSEDEPVRSTSKPKEETSIPTSGKNEKNMDIVLTLSGEHTKDKSSDANGSPKDNTMDTTSSLRSDDEPVISILKSECISKRSLKKDADGPMGAGKKEDIHEQLGGKYKEKTIQERISNNFVVHYNDIEYKLSEPELENVKFSIQNDIKAILTEMKENLAINESKQPQENTSAEKNGKMAKDVAIIYSTLQIPPVAEVKNKSSDVMLTFGSEDRSAEITSDHQNISKRSLKKRADQSSTEDKRENNMKEKVGGEDSRCKKKPIPKLHSKHSVDQIRRPELENVTSVTHDTIKTTFKEQQEWLHRNGNKQHQFEEERKLLKSHEMQVSGNTPGCAASSDDGDDSGLTQQRMSRNLDNKQFPIKKHEQSSQKQLRREEQCHKEVDVKLRLELTCKTLRMELKTSKNNLNQESTFAQSSGSSAVVLPAFHSDQQEHTNDKLSDVGEQKGKSSEAIFTLRSEDKTAASTSDSQVLTEVITSYYINIYNEIQDLKKKVSDIRRQFQDAQDQQKDVHNAEKMQDQLKKLNCENSELKDSIREKESKIEHLKNNLLNPHLFLKARDKYQEAVQNTEMSQDHLESYRLERANSDLKNTIRRQAILTEELRKILISTQGLVQMSSQGNSEFLRDNDNSSIRSRVEPEIKEVDSGLFKISQPKEEFFIELEKYNQFHRKKVEVGETFANKAYETDNQLTVIRTKFPQEKQWNECLPRTNAMRRALESSSVTRLSSSLICNRAFVPQKCLGIPASQPSYHSTLESLDTIQISSHKNPECLAGSTNPSTRSKKEHGIEGQESKASEEMEKYRQLYQEQAQVRTSLLKKLDETNEKLAGARMKYLQHMQRACSITKSLTTSPLVESHSVGNCTENLLLSSNITSQDNLRNPALRPQSSQPSMPDCLDMSTENERLWKKAFQIIEGFSGQQKLTSMQNKQRCGKYKVKN